MKATLITGFYIIIAIINIYTGISGNLELNQLSKAILMPNLLFLLFTLANGQVTLPRLILGLGLIFSWGGDILLSFQTEEIYFLGGLGMFLCAQLSYAFVMNKSSFQKLSFSFKKLLPVFAYALILMFFIIPKAGNMILPILAYAFCIFLMLSIARLREGFTNSKSFQYTMIGAALFVLSDSVIAINKFVIEVPFASAWIMSTYIVAQYLIVKGILEHPAD